MITMMNQYLSNLNLIYDDITKSLLTVAVKDCEYVQNINVIIRNNKFIVDIKLKKFSEENATYVMNLFMENTHFPYSSFYVRLNEGNQIRYRYASCRENKQGFYCDVVIS